jgi:hypothetical protein
VAFSKKSLITNIQHYNFQNLARKSLIQIPQATVFQAERRQVSKGPWYCPPGSGS